MKYLLKILPIVALAARPATALQGPSVPPLADKAAYFEERLQKRHIRDGLVRELTLNVPGEPQKGGFLLSDDNDGLWTSLYAAAMSFKYAATRDETARRQAAESFAALETLESVTGIPGFPARSYVPEGEPKGRGYDGEWHPDASGKWEWKGDTSSDEIDGHFYAYALYYDLAADETGKNRVRALTTRVMDHILDHDLYLVDKDGKPTLWGVWNPAQLNRNRPLPGRKDQNWKDERGLNSLEILSHLKTAWHITGNERYRKKYIQLIRKHGYADNVARENILDPADLNHSDAELALLAFYPLLKYETDPELLNLYKTGLRRAWELMRPERNPWWNFTVCAFLEGDCGKEDALRTLTEIPWQQINWRRDNRERADVRKNPKNPALSAEVLPYSEICIQRWNGNPYLLDTGGKGDIEGDGVIFLLPYWMGRSHGFIENDK